MLARDRRPATRSARLRPAAMQRLSDPSAPPGLDMPALPVHQPVGGPVPDDGLVVEDGNVTARPERSEEVTAQALIARATEAAALFLRPRSAQCWAQAAGP